MCKVWIETVPFTAERKFEHAADALIAAGIGDVKEAEAEVNRYETLYKLQGRDMALAERRAYEAELRAEVAESELERYTALIKPLEHRAEVAEMALKKFAENITCEDCPFFSDCASSEKMEDLMHSNYCFAEYLKQAEKELAEEEKND